MLQILEATAKNTNNNLSNLVKTTASTSQIDFINSMNKAYMEVSTGVKSYTQSIIDTIDELSKRSATVVYPSGYKTSIENAVRMNIVTSTNQMCGKLQEIRADEMDCDLMEITAHSGARPSHAEWQGKIVSRSGKKGYLSLDDIGYGEATGFKGVNCRHDWYPYYEGSARTYTQEQLNNWKNETVTYNGKEISKYDASQLQRKMERQIRQDKKDIAGLQGILTSNTSDNDLIKRAKQELQNKNNKLKEHNSVLDNFEKQTNSRKDYNRLYIGNAKNENVLKNIGDKGIINKNVNKEENKLNYIDITNKYTTRKNYQVKKQKYFVDEDGTKYNVDGKHVILKPTEREVEVAKLLGETIGGKVNIIPKVNKPTGIKTPDYIINGEKFDLKQITGGGKYAIQGNLKGKEKQSNNFVIDISNAKFNIKEAQRQIDNIYNSKHYLWLNKIILIQEYIIIRA